MPSGNTKWIILVYGMCWLEVCFVLNSTNEINCLPCMSSDIEPHSWKAWCMDAQISHIDGYWLSGFLLLLTSHCDMYRGNHFNLAVIATMLTNLLFGWCSQYLLIPDFFYLISNSYVWCLFSHDYDVHSKRLRCNDLLSRYHPPEGAVANYLSVDRTSAASTPASWSWRSSWHSQPVDECSVPPGTDMCCIWRSVYVTIMPWHVVFPLHQHFGSCCNLRIIWM
jgi:hypothetical protein